MHSSTKYLGGHSDVIQGALVMNDKELREKLYFIQKSCGAVPGPWIVFLYCVVLKLFIYVCSVIVKTGKRLLITCATILRLEKCTGAG
jgi:hypothetical protein